MRSFRLFVIVEAAILVLLALRLLTHRGSFIPAVVLALLFTLLATGIGRGLWRQLFSFLAVLFWLFVIVLVLTTGYFWLLLIWPVVWGAFIYRRDGGQRQYRTVPGAVGRSGGPRDVTGTAQDLPHPHGEGNDVIDLAELTFHPTGNVVQISKSAGNTKVVVPSDVAISLTASVADGVIRVFGRAPVLDATDFRYQSDGYESHEKRVELRIRVAAGNIEIVRG